jgi:hypothetical protein
MTRQERLSAVLKWLPAYGCWYKLAANAYLHHFKVHVSARVALATRGVLFTREKASCICVKVSGVAKSVQCLATGWTTGPSRFDPRQRRKGFSSSLCVQPALEPTQAPTQWVPGVLSPGAKAWPGCDSEHPPLDLTSRMSRSYITSSPKRLRGV